jgi:hypothetical protein
MLIKLTSSLASQLPQGFGLAGDLDSAPIIVGAGLPAMTAEKSMKVIAGRGRTVQNR